MERQQVSALVLLDLTAAFDTIDHQLLLSRLKSVFGISGTAHTLLSSYLSDRFQSVSIRSHCSDQHPLLYGVPQGSVLGPLLFTLYTTPLASLLENSQISFHLYADDTQLYISFSSDDCDDALATLSSALDRVHSWLHNNHLTLNPSKTEFLLFGTKQQRSKLSCNFISFSNTTVSCSDSVRNLGVIFDQELSFSKHISLISKS